MCATKTYASATTVLIPQPGGQIWSVFARVPIAVVDAFREALAMRRAAQSKYLLNDE